MSRAFKRVLIGRPLPTTDAGHQRLSNPVALASSVAYATEEIRAVTVEVDEAQTEALREEWTRFAAGVPLDVVESPYRSLIDPVIDYIRRVEEESGQLVTVVIPEFVPHRLWHRFLHNQTALLLSAALSVRPNVIVTTVRIPLDG